MRIVSAILISFWLYIIHRTTHLLHRHHTDNNFLSIYFPSYLPQHRADKHPKHSNDILHCPKRANRVTTYDKFKVYRFTIGNLISRFIIGRWYHIGHHVNEFTQRLGNGHIFTCFCFLQVR